MWFAGRSSEPDGLNPFQRQRGDPVAKRVLRITRIDDPQVRQPEVLLYDVH